jgi:hypothetical protein
MLVGQGWVSPSEFWAMPPGSVWWLIESKTPESAVDYEPLYQMLMEAEG